MPVYTHATLSDAEVLYDFTAQDKAEMSVKKGDFLETDW